MYNKFRLCDVLGHKPHRLLVVAGDIFSECSVCGRIGIEKPWEKNRWQHTSFSRVYNELSLDELVREYLMFEKLRNANVDEAIKTLENAPDSFESLEDAETIRNYVSVLDSNVSTYTWIMEKLQRKIAIKIPLYEKWIKVTVNDVEYALAKTEGNKEEPFIIHVKLWDERGNPPKKQYGKKFV